MAELKMPSLGAYMEKGKVLQWLVAPGDEVKRNQSVAVVDTDKAAVEIESFQEGRVERLVAQVGDVVKVGETLAVLTGGEAAAPSPQPPTAAPESRAPSPPTPQPQASEPSQTAPQPTAGSLGPATPTPPPRPGEIAGRASPRARRLAAEAGIDITGLTGSGPTGAVIERDVQRAIDAGEPATKPVERPGAEAPAGRASATGPGSMRHAIAAAMAQANREIPHYYLGTTIALQPALAWLQQQNETRPVEDRLLPVALFVRATVLAAAAVPEMNGWYEAGGFAHADQVNVAIAINLRRGGLLLPVVHDAASLSLDALMAQLHDLVTRARRGRLTSREVTGASLTITSLGERSADVVYGVIYPPQVALVGFGEIVTRPCVIEDHVAPGALVHASLAADHRVSDGHRGAVFLAEIRRRLQEPATL